MTKSPRKNVLDMGIELGLLACQADTLPIELPCPAQNHASMTHVIKRLRLRCAVYFLGYLQELTVITQKQKHTRPWYQAAWEPNVPRPLSSLMIRMTTPTTTLRNSLCPHCLPGATPGKRIYKKNVQFRTNEPHHEKTCLCYM